MSEADKNSAKQRLPLRYLKFQVAAIQDSIVGSGVELMEVFAVSTTVSQDRSESVDTLLGFLPRASSYSNFSGVVTVGKRLGDAVVLASARTCGGQRRGPVENLIDSSS